MQQIQRTATPREWRRRFPSAAIFALVLAILASCDQSSLFYDISTETKPKDPVIPGSPSVMAMFPAGSKNMWISNGRLYRFDGTSWSRASGPEGTVRSLAVANGFLYALTIDGGNSTNTRLWRTADGSTWTRLTLDGTVASYSFLESIYAAGPAGLETLFVGAHIPAGESDPVSGYGVLYANGTKLEKVLTNLNPDDSSGALVGAAYAGTTYYLATTKAGIFASDVDAISGYDEIDGTAGDTYILSALGAVGGTFVAAGRGEYLLYGTAAGFTAKRFRDIMFIGSMATWDETGDGTPDLILLPIDDDDDAYTYGYREIALNGGAFPADPSLKTPGNGTPTTVADNDQYDSSLGQEAVRSMFQYVFGGTRVLYASTYINGLWSYRDEEWNAEE